MSQETELTFENDPLILDKDDFHNGYVNANDLIKNRKTDLLSIENIPNIFSALVKSEDFKRKVPLHTIPYATGKKLDQILRKLLIHLPEYTNNNHLQLRRLFKVYMKQNITKQFRNYISWFENGRYPLVLLRFLAFIYSRKNELDEKQLLSKIINGVEHIVNAKGEGNLIVPKLMKELITKNKAYILGASFGDGCLLLDDSRWTITDGHKDMKALPFSYDYLKTINDLIIKEFGISGTIRKGPGNKYVLMINNKFFCRFLNFFYGAKFGIKTDLKVPLIFDLSDFNHELKRQFFSGLIDTDGSLLKNSPNMQIELNNSDDLIDQLSSFLSENGIENAISTHPPSKRLFIPTRSFKRFIELIDLKHPYKRSLGLNHLNKGTKARFLKSIKKTENIDFLKKYSLTLRVFGAGELIKNLIEKYNLDKRKLARNLNIKEKTISAWVNNVNSVPLNSLIKIANVGGHDTTNLLKELINLDVKWGYGQIKVRLPSNIRDVIPLAKFIRPGHTYIYVVNGGNNARSKIISQIESIFGVMPSYEKSKNTYRFSSEILRDYFNFFFKYEKPW